MSLNRGRSKPASESSLNKPRSRSRTPNPSPPKAGKKIMPAPDSPEDEDIELAPWVRKNTLKFKDSLLLLHEEIIDFYDFMQPTPSEKADQQSILNRLTEKTRNIWPNSEVNIFGSLANGLWLPTSDIDIVIKTQTDQDSATLIDLLSSDLVQSAMASEIEKIYNARVPIIKFVDRSTGLHVDISFNISGGIEGVNIVKEYLAKYPEVKYIVFVLKYFLKQRGLNETYLGGIGSFLLFCMVVSSVQMHPAHKGDNKHYGRYTLGHFLVNFFQLYGSEFNYLDVGISIKGNGSYFQKRTKEWCQTLGDFLCVECPQDTNNDVGKGAFGIKMIRKTFKHAHLLLCSQCYRVAKTPLNLILRTDDLIRNRYPHHKN
ncbi:unnamed protein product [Blepharisma stoltei]|uniref:polynucleotide adenylyltransferase n=1 Tax=Blepharisma stoltei TaxID=1481888 RepID=A0AAU9IG90_9CILI|nr:unnamed protein product [Blepharisma stoltei]